MIKIKSDIRADKDWVTDNIIAIEREYFLKYFKHSKKEVNDKLKELKDDEKLIYTYHKTGNKEVVIDKNISIPNCKDVLPKNCDCTVELSPVVYYECEKALRIVKIKSEKCNKAVFVDEKYTDIFGQFTIKTNMDNFNPILGIFDGDKVIGALVSVRAIDKTKLDIKELMEIL